MPDLRDLATSVLARLVSPRGVAMSREGRVPLIYMPFSQDEGLRALRYAAGLHVSDPALAGLLARAKLRAAGADSSPSTVFLNTDYAPASDQNWFGPVILHEVLHALAGRALAHKYEPVAEQILRRTPGTVQDEIRRLRPNITDPALAAEALALTPGAYRGYVPWPHASGPPPEVQRIADRLAELWPQADPRLPLAGRARKR
jgi:hypothetical protein